MSASTIDIRLLNRAREQIDELIDNKSSALTTGMSPDFADYKYRCGEIAGLRTALEMMAEIVRAMGDERPR